MRYFVVIRIWLLPPNSFTSTPPWNASVTFSDGFCRYFLVKTHYVRTAAGKVNSVRKALEQNKAKSYDHDGSKGDVVLFTVLHKLDFGILQEILRYGSVKRDVFAFGQPSVHKQTGNKNGRKQRGYQTNDQRSGKALYRSRAENHQDTAIMVVRFPSIIAE